MCFQNSLKEETVDYLTHIYLTAFCLSLPAIWAKALLCSTNSPNPHIARMENSFEKPWFTCSHLFYQSDCGRGLTFGLMFSFFPQTFNSTISRTDFCDDWHLPATVWHLDPPRSFLTALIHAKPYENEVCHWLVKQLIPSVLIQVTSSLHHLKAAPCLPSLHTKYRCGTVWKQRCCWWKTGSAGVSFATGRSGSLRSLVFLLNSLSEYLTFSIRWKPSGVPQACSLTTLTLHRDTWIALRFTLSPSYTRSLWMSPFHSYF